MTESVTDAPLMAATVDLVRFAGDVIQTRVTDSAGDVAFDAIPSGEYLVRARKPGYKNLESKLENGASRTDVSANLRMESAAPYSASGSAPIVSVGTLKLPAKAVEQYEKGSELLQKHRAQESLEHFEKAIAAAPAFCEAYYLKGMALLELKSSDAEAALAKAIELNARFMPPYYPLALALFSERRYSDEQKVLQDAIAQEPVAWQWPFEMARSFASEKQWNAAAQYVQIALARPNAASKVHLLASDIYSKVGRPEQAVAQLEEFLKTDPNSPYAKRVNEVLPTLRREVSDARETAKQSAIPLNSQ